MRGQHLTSHADTMTADVGDLMDRDFLSDPDKHRSHFQKLKQPFLVNYFHRQARNVIF